MTYRPWPTSDADIAILTLAQVELTTDTLKNAICCAGLEHGACAFGAHVPGGRGGIAGWVVILAGHGDWPATAAYPVCCICWGHYGGPGGAYFEMRHVLFEPQWSRRRQQRGYRQ
jgi:hypothetical protein